MDSKNLSDRELLAQLERLTGRKIRSREDIADYVSEMSARATQVRTHRLHLKNALLGALLVVSAAQYYFIDVQLTILSQPTLTVFVPVRDGVQRPYLGG